MDESTQGIYIFWSMAIIFSLCWHWFVHRYFRAIAGSSVMTAVIFTVVAYVHSPDPQAGVALIFTALYTFLISAVIGLPFKLARVVRKNNRGLNSTSSLRKHNAVECRR